MKWGLGPAMAWGKNTLELICCLARWHASNIKVKTRSVQSSDNFSNFCTFVCALLTISSAVSVVLFAPRTCNSHWRIGARSLGTSKQPQQAATYVFRFCMTFKLCICTAIAFQKRSCCDSLQLYWGCMESPFVRLFSVQILDLHTISCPNQHPSRMAHLWQLARRPFATSPHRSHGAPSAILEAGSAPTDWSMDPTDDVSSQCQCCPHQWRVSRSTSVCPRNLKTCTCTIGTLQT